MSDDQLYETLKRSATNHIKAFESPNPFDADAIYACRTTDSFMIFHPSNSVPAPWGSGAKITPEMHHPGAKAIGAAMNGVKAEVENLIIDVKKRTVVAQVKMFYDIKGFGDEAEDKGYMCEYVWITQHDDSGEKIVRMDEFIDPIRAGYMLEKVGRYNAQLTS